MENFNYNNAKFILFTSAQYGDSYTIDGDTVKNITGSLKPINNVYNPNLKKFINPDDGAIGANGYVIMPIMSDKNDYVHGLFTINQIDSESLNENMDKCVNEICNFIDSILQLDSEANLWIGTPQITSNNYKNTRSTLAVTTLSTYTLKLKAKLDNTVNGKNIWADNVRGFFYNQESIYTPDSFKYNEHLIFDNFEVLCMYYYSSMIHDSITDDDGNHVRIYKSLIWIPFLPTMDQGLTEAEVFKRICHVIEMTQIFDFAFIQPHLVNLYSLIYNNNDDIKYTEEQIADNHKHGSQNISVICEAMKNGYLSYRHSEGEEGVRVLDNDSYIQESNNLKRKCRYGAEYELNEDIEGSNKTLNLFNEYRNGLDNYVGAHPMLFYWQGETCIDKVTQKIKDIYAKESSIIGEQEHYAVSASTVTTDYTNYTNSLNIGVSSNLDVMNTHFAEPTNSNLTLDVSDLGFNKGDEAQIEDIFVHTYLADHPEKYWIKKISTTYSYNEEKISNVTLKATLYSSSEASEKGSNNTFKLYSKNLLTNLGISIVNPLDESDNIVVFEDNNDEVNSFIKIHNWLVDNVEYIECRDNTYDDCAFGAIVTKKANSKGVSTALSVLCKIAGIPCLVVPGTKNGITHYWNYVKLDGAWRFVDASLNHADENDSYKYRYFLRKIPVSYIKSYSVPKIMVSDENYIKYGKVSGNEDITANDAAIVLEMALNQDYMDKCSSISIIEADVTGDGIITSEDASEILSKSSNYDFKFSVESKLDKYR